MVGKLTNEKWYFFSNRERVFESSNHDAMPLPGELSIYLYARQSR